MFTVEQKARNIHLVRLDCKSARWESHWLLSSDRHHDNPKADHELEQKHLEEARALGAGIIDVGDLFCCLEGRADPRRSRAGVRPEHATCPDYFDSVVKYAHDFYAPYAQNFVVVARGRVIRVATWQSEEELLDTVLHELIHCCRPELEEATVTEMAREMARVMWRLGYRRAEPPPLPGLPAAPRGRSGARRPR